MSKSKVAQIETDVQSESRIRKLSGDAALVPKEVGVCLNDLHFMAAMVSRGLGCANPESPIAIVQAAVNQATFELKLIAEELPDGSDEQYSLLGVVDRLEAAAAGAETLFKLLQLPNFSRATQPAEVQP